MARTVRNPKLDTRSARAKLKPRREPYWCPVAPSRSIGYRRLGPQGGTWIAKLRLASVGRWTHALGPADDALDAGGDVLTFAAAQERARVWFMEKEQEIAGPPKVAFGPFTVGDALDSYLEWFAQHRKSLRNTRYVVESHIRPALGDREVKSLTTDELRAWHQKLAATPARVRSGLGQPERHRALPNGPEGLRSRRATANRVLTVLKAALNHANHEGRIPGADAEVWCRVRAFRGADAARVRYLDEGECRRLLNACATDFRELVRGALSTGCRYGELCRLEVRDFSRESGSLLVREAKAGRPRWVPLDDEAAAFLGAIAAGRAGDDPLFRRADGRAWQRSDQKRPLLRACAAARIDPPASFHCLRHTWASHRVMRGMPLLAVAHVLGHADTRMVERHYGHLAPSYIRDAVRATAMDLGPRNVGNVAPLRSAG